MRFVLVFFGAILAIGNGILGENVCGFFPPTMVCSNRNLSNISFVPPCNDATSLLFDGNKVEVLHRSSFIGVPNIMSLNLRNNIISIIETDAFEDLTKLKYLYLDINKISDVRTLVLPHGTTDLTLSRNVRLLGNNLSGPNATNLNYLDLAECNIKDFSELTLEHLPQVKKLDLRRNSLSKLHSKWFFPSQQITTLILSRNEISTLNIDSNDLKHLSYLDLSFNMLSSLSADLFFRTPNLQSLNLDGNRFRRIEPLVHGTLTSLSLAMNSLRWLSPEAFKELANLQTLNLNTNVLSDVEGVFNVSMPGLKELQLSENFIEAVNRDTLSGLTSLRILRVDGNEELEILDQSSFENIKLSELNITNTHVACQCSFQYWSLVEWAYDSNVNLSAGCWSEKTCEDKPMPTSTQDPDITCVHDPTVCPPGERCCFNLKCSVNYKCDASVLCKMPLLMLAMLVTVLINSR